MKMKGLVEWVIAIVDEGRKFIGPEEVSNLEHADFLKKKPMLTVRAQLAFNSPTIIQNPSLQDKACCAAKRKRAISPTSKMIVSS